MSRELDWREPALNVLAGFLADDPEGLRQLISALDGLTSEPEPKDSVELGNPALRRLRVGRYRAVYQVSDSTVLVAHVGRVG